MHVLLTTWGEAIDVPNENRLGVEMLTLIPSNIPEMVLIPPPNQVEVILTPCCKYGYEISQTEWSILTGAIIWAHVP